MSDASVSAALRSPARLVLIEAPAGCGKTYQGAEYAREVARVSTERLLILTHTHAACSVFSDRTRNAGGHVEIRTLDGLITQVAAGYHAALGLPSDVGTWARRSKDGHQLVARRLAALLVKYPMIARVLARRYPTLICDEHQDCSVEQHAICMAIARQGARMLIFFDPLQRIFRAEDGATISWDDLRGTADVIEDLDTPHRWKVHNEALGQWILRSRGELKAGRPIDLSGDLPDGLSVLIAENVAHQHLEYQLARDQRGPIDAFTRRASSLLILAHHNATARSLRGVFYRSIPLWEGHTRSGLESLVEKMQAKQGDGPALAEAIVEFMGQVAKGFSASAFGDVFQREVHQLCAVIRKGKPAKLQDLARLLLREPDHRGVAKVLAKVDKLRQCDSDFGDIKIDSHREFWEAVRLEKFEDPETGLREITRRRAFAPASPPPRAISTIHKAKGLECEDVVVLPCDGRTFPDREDTRCLLYVALSRAKRRLLIVASRKNPSPLVRL